MKMVLFIILHISVLQKEAVNFLNIKNNGIYIDCTFGAGGHSREILSRCENITLFCIDRDISVKSNFDKLKLDFPNSDLTFIHEKFGNLAKIIADFNLVKIDGILFDFGVSSMQIDNCERGFSFQKDAPLSMQMGLNKISAHEVINSLDEVNLANIIYNYGDEKKSRIIAKSIIRERDKSPIETTLKLAEIIKKTIGRYNDTIHPATRTFQAIRIYVNDEILEIKNAIKTVYSSANNNISCVCISFHSLEDSIIKDFIKQHDKIQLLKDNFDKNYNYIQENQVTEKSKFVHVPYFTKKLHNGVILPSKDEIKFNVRSRSARMRAFGFIKNDDFRS